MTQTVPATRLVDVRPLTSSLGAEIVGLDLRDDLADDVVGELRSALLGHRFLLFRDQTLDHDAHVAFAARFGTPTYAHPHDDHPPSGRPEIYTIDPEREAARFGPGDRQRAARYARGWHTDVSAVVNPPFASIVRAERVAAIGGETSVTDLVAAYEDLSAPVRALLDGLHGEHRYDAAVIRHGGHQHDRFVRNQLVSHHPLVRVHPDTGERALYVNPGFVSRIVELRGRESERLLRFLFDHIARPDFTAQFRWAPGTVAFWDNRVTAHLPPRVASGSREPHVLHRVTLAGDRPVGVHGQTSVAIHGEPFTTARLFDPADN